MKVALPAFVISADSRQSAAFIAKQGTAWLCYLVCIDAHMTIPEMGQGRQAEETTHTMPVFTPYHMCGQTHILYITHRPALVALTLFLMVQR